jgi:beta-xylosidase
MVPMIALCQLPISNVWVADNGDGTYKNPIIHADYSDPDLVRAGDDFYMTSSSFNCIPGLPILHSKDLVNWELIGHGIKRLIPEEVFNTPQHGNGVWAPCIRFYNNQFYIYWGDPDFGIYVIKATDPAGPWSEPLLVKAGKGLIDPSPLWDDDGKAYLVHAFAGSRAGIKSVLVVNEMNPEGTAITRDEVMVFDGHAEHPTIEGSKFYKKDGYYYIFAPAGGVTHGWQLVLRSKNIYGPYEEKIVMSQGNTDINGPHQGGWVTTATGEDWFIHFQDKEAYGRIVHLNPMVWKNGWPVIGTDKKETEPENLYSHIKNLMLEKPTTVVTPPESDEFNGSSLGLQWQWHANPHISFGFPSGNLWLLQVKLHCQA